MAQIKQHDPRFRYKTKIAEDIATVLNTDLKYGTKRAVMEQAAWVWTEYHGKFRGCPYWSAAALMKFEQGHSDTQIAKYATHEHLVPRSFFYRVMDTLIERETPITPLEVFYLCERLLVGVVVTHDEDKALNAKKLRQKMPETYGQPGHPDYLNPWSRYKQPGAYIHVVSATGRFNSKMLPVFEAGAMPEWYKLLPPRVATPVAPDGCACVTCTSHGGMVLDRLMSGVESF